MIKNNTGGVVMTRFFTHEVWSKSAIASMKASEYPIGDILDRTKWSSYPFFEKNERYIKILLEVKYSKDQIIQVGFDKDVVEKVSKDLGESHSRDDNQNYSKTSAK